MKLSQFHVVPLGSVFNGWASRVPLEVSCAAGNLIKFERRPSQWAVLPTEVMLADHHGLLGGRLGTLRAEEVPVHYSIASSIK